MALLPKGLVAAGLLVWLIGPRSVWYYNCITSPKIPGLPTEIWAMILEEALNSIYRTDYRHDPKRFHHFVGTHQYKYSPYNRDRSLELTLMRLRLVCKRWNVLLSCKGELWVFPHSIRSAKVRSSRSIPLQRMDYGTFGVSTVPTNNWVTQMDFQRRVKRGDLQSLKLLGINRGVGAEDELDAIVQDILFAEPAATPILHTIVLFRFHGCRSIFQGIQRNFSGIKVLILCSGHIIQGTLELNQVDTLILHATALDIKKWKFPSLRYYSIGADDPTITSNYIPIDVPAPTSQLLCLDLSFYVAFTADDNFWSTHGSLRSLSVKEPRFYFVADAPETHPIEHLSLNSGVHFSHNEGLWEGRVEDEMKAALDHVPNLRYLSINCLSAYGRFSSNGEVAIRCMRPWWWRLFRERRGTHHDPRGTIWLDETGEEVKERWHWKVRTTKAWEPAIATIIYTIWAADFFWAAYSRELLSRVSTKSSMIVSFILWLLYHSWAVYDHYAA